MKIIRSFFLLLLCPLLLLQVSCVKNEKTPQEILEALMETAGELPSGVIYQSNAEEGNEGYASPQLLSALYGEEAEKRFETVEAYAIYLSSFASPSELAVLRCYSTTDAIRLEELCLQRSDELRVALKDTPYEALSNGIQVLLKGKWVVFILCEDAEAVGREALQSID